MGNKKKKKKKSCREQVSEIFFFFFSFFPPSKKSPGPPPFLPNDTDQKKAESMAQNVLVMGKKKESLPSLSLPLSRSIEIGDTGFFGVFHPRKDFREFEEAASALLTEKSDIIPSPSNRNAQNLPTLSRASHIATTKIAVFPFCFVPFFLFR